MEADVEDDNGVLQDGEEAVDPGLAVGDVPPVAEHTGQDSQQVEEEKYLFKNQWSQHLFRILFQTAVTEKSYYVNQK